MTTAQVTNLQAGDVLESVQSRDRGRRVRVVGPKGSHAFTVENIATGKRTDVGTGTLRRSYRLLPFESPIRTAAKQASRRNSSRRAAKSAPRLNTERQRELHRILKDKFAEYGRRGQHFYLGGGMSTTHVVVAVMQDIDALQIFWPPELTTSHGLFGGNTYALKDKNGKSALIRVQSRIRESLNELADLGALEKVGNSDERRWKLA
jgi:hypothetical protein